MVERVLGREIGSTQIKVTIGYKDFEIRVMGHGSAQSLSNIDVSILELCIRPRMHKSAQDFIGQISLEIQLTADVIVERSHKRTSDIRQQRIIFGRFGNAQTVTPCEAAVEPANS